MRKVLILIGCAFFVCSSWLSGQTIAELMPCPRSMSQEAALPAEMQRKLDRTVQERAAKNMHYGEVAYCQSAFLLQAFNLFVRHNDSVFCLQDPPYQNLYTYVPPKMEIINSSHGHEAVKGSGAKFNVKKDRLSSVLLDNSQCLYVVNRNDELCDPALFEFSADGEGIHMEGNRIVLDATPREIAMGEYAARQRITVRHIGSQATYHYDLQLSFEDSLSWRGQKKAIAVMSYPTPVFPQLGAVLNLTDKTISFVQLPLTIHGEGTDGKNGRRGYNGANGTNAYTWTDKDGKKHTSPGTCARPGGNGEDGSDGTDAGQFFIMMDVCLESSMGLECITAWIDPGIGGEGGKGGEGGIHGRGSSCRGKAPDGADGRHGRNGQRGDFLYVIGDVQTWFNTAMR